MLVRDTAYNSLLRSKRQLLHGQIATVLSDRETEPEVLAYHFSKAGLVDQAVAKWLEAAEGAWGRAAHREAVAHLQHGLQLITDLPSSDEKARAELRVQNMLGLITIAAEGPSATAEAALARARGLGDQLGEPAQLFPVLFGQWYLNLLRMDLRTATHSAEELLENSAVISNDSLGLQAHHACWTTSCLVGNLHSARVHAEAGVALYSAEQHHILSGRFAGHDPGVCCRYTLGIALWLLGYPDQSIRWIEESLGLARTLDHPLTHILAGTYASWAFQLRREPDRVRDIANITAKHCNEQNVETWGLAAATMTAWVRATLERDAGVLAPMQQLLRKMQDLRFLFVARTTSAYLPMPAPSLEMWRRVLPLLMQPSMWCANTVKVGTSQSSTGYVLTYCWLTIEIKRPRQNGLFARRSMLRGRVPQSPLSFEQLAIWLACGLKAVNGRKRVISSRRFATGLPRASKPPT